MTYTKTGPFTDGGAPYLSAALFNNIENALTGATYTAPAPSGGDDTAALQALLNTAQSTGGTLVLQAGTYKANLATAQSFTQPRILGQGMNLTTIQGTVNTSPVLRFKGGSGQFSGGYFADLTVTGTGGVGIEIADACGMKWARTAITGTFTEGLRFHNESVNAFSEYNTGDATIASTVALPVHYKVTSGSNSFHGTGLTHGTVINLATGATGPAIQIDSGAFPYAAPLTAAIFPRAANAVLIRNSNTGSPASFFGSLDVEVQGGVNTVTVADTTGNRVLYNGGIGGLITGTNLKLGNLYLIDKAYYSGGSTFVAYKPVRRSTVLGAGTTTVFPDAIGAALIEIDIVASNYHYAYLLHCWQSPYNSGGTVTQVANPQSLNTAGLGAPTFAWTNYGLTVTNAAYTSAVTAYVRATQVDSYPTATDTLGQ